MLLLIEEKQHLQERKWKIKLAVLLKGTISYFIFKTEICYHYIKTIFWKK